MCVLSKKVLRTAYKGKVEEFFWGFGLGKYTWVGEIMQKCWRQISYSELWDSFLNSFYLQVENECFWRSKGWWDDMEKNSGLRLFLRVSSAHNVWKFVLKFVMFVTKCGLRHSTPPVFKFSFPKKECHQHPLPPSTASHPWSQTQERTASCGPS